MSNGGGEDFYVDLDALERFANLVRDEREKLLRELQRVFAEHAVFGTRQYAWDLASAHTEALRKMRDLAMDIDGGGQTAEMGLREVKERYEKVDATDAAMLRDIKAVLGLPEDA